MDTFGLKDLLGEVNKPAQHEDPESVTMSVVGGKVVCGKKFEIVIEMRGTSGGVVPVGNGYELEVVGDATGVGGVTWERKGGGWTMPKVKIDKEGEYELKCTVKYPDGRTEVEGRVVLTAVEDRAASESLSESEELRKIGESDSESSSESFLLLPPNADVTTWAFSYRTDRDKKGILYYLGLNKLKSKRWKNPMERGIVRVTSSSLRKGDLQNFVDRTPIDQVLTTDDSAGSWIMLDLNDYVCAANTYTLSGRCDKSRDVLTDWTFEGSMDGKLWVVLHTHVEDEALNQARLKGKASSTWKIPQCKYYLRFFRVKIGDRGNTTRSNILAATCFELYGLLRKRKQHEAEESKGVPLPLEKPILNKLQLKVHREESNNEWQSMIAKRFSLTDRKRAAEQAKQSKRSKK